MGLRKGKKLDYTKIFKNHDQLANFLMLSPESQKVILKSKAEENKGDLTMCCTFKKGQDMRVNEITKSTWWKKFINYFKTKSDGHRK